MIGYVVLPVLIMLALSVLGTDGQWGRGVRGAVRGASGQGAGSVRDRLSGARSGWVSGSRDKTPSTLRTVGKTPPQDTLLSGVLGRLSELSSRAVRKIKDRVAGHRPDDHRPLLLMRPDGTSEYVDIYDDFAEVALKPGERIVNVDRNGKVGETAWDYANQERIHADEAAPDSPTQAAANDTAPAATAAGPSEGENMRDDQLHSYAAAPGDHERFLAEADAAEAARQTHPRLADRGFTASGHGMIGPSLNSGAANGSPASGAANGSPASVDAIETLPEYRRYLNTVRDRAQAEIDDAQATVQRLTNWSHAIREAVSRFAAAHGDPKTIAEGNSVSEHAHIAKENALHTQRLLNELVDHIQIALAGLARHDMVQEAHDAGTHLDRHVYNGN